MKKMRKILRQGGSGRDGGVLLLVIMVLLVTSLLGMGLMAQGSVDAVESARLLNRTKAFWLAEAGLNELKGIISSETNRRRLDENTLVGEELFVRSIDGVGSYSISIREGSSEERESGIQYVVTSTSHVAGNDSVVLSSAIRLTTVSENIWVSNSEGSVYFGDDDEIFGSIRTNGKFNIRGKPKIYGEAQSSGDSINYDDNPTVSSVADPDVFLGGMTFGVAETDFNSDLIDEMQEKSGIDAIDGDCTITFMSDGTYEVETVERIWVPKNNNHGHGGGAGNYTFVTNTVVASIDAIGDGSTDDNIIYVNGVVSVKGCVAGTVSVVSSDAVIIVDDLVYASSIGYGSPESWDALGYEPNAEEALGLYAKNKVEIDYTNPYDENGDGRDINLHAAVFVSEKDEYARVDNPGFGTADRAVYLGTPDINFYGSIVQFERGVVAQWLDNGWVGHKGGWTGEKGSWGGYNKNYHQDIRFLRAPPPGSPSGPPEFFSWKMASR